MSVITPLITWGGFESSSGALPTQPEQTHPNRMEMSPAGASLEKVGTLAEHHCSTQQCTGTRENGSVPQEAEESAMETGWQCPGESPTS